MKRIFWFVLLSPLAACSQLRPAPVPVAAPPLLAPAALGSSRHTLQIVHAAFGEREASLQCVLTVDAQRIGVIGLGANGQRLFSLDYDGRDAHAQSSPLLPAQLPPERFLADLQLAYWPLAALRTAYSDSGWQVSEPQPGTRRLRQAGQLVAEVHYSVADPWSGRLWLSNFRYGYTLSVESSALGDAP